MTYNEGLSRIQNNLHLGMRLPEWEPYLALCWSRHAQWLFVHDQRHGYASRLKSGWIKFLDFKRAKELSGWVLVDLGTFEGVE